MYKYLYMILFLFTTLVLAGCSDKNKKDEPLIEWGEPSCVVEYGDGTQYGLIGGYSLILRDASGLSVKKIDFSGPDPIYIDTGYGDTQEGYYVPIMGRLGRNIVIGFYSFYRKWNNVLQIAGKMEFDFTPAFLYIFDKELNGYSIDKINNGFLFIQDDLLLSMRDDFSYTLYDSDISIIRTGEAIPNIHYDYTEPAIFANFDDTQYVLVSVEVDSVTGQKQYIIVNLINGIYETIKLPTLNEIIADNFSNTEPEPKYFTKKLSLGSNCFIIDFDFIQYDGSHRQISYTIKLDGTVINKQ